MRFFFFFFVCTSSLGLFAQSGNKDSVGKSLEEVVVIAQRQQQQSLIVPYSVSVVKEDELSRLGSRNTPDALAGINGVFMQRTNFGGGSPFVRGVTGNQTLILVDGIRLNNSSFRYGPNQYLNTIDHNLITRIEVAKGTGSVQYGSDAIGGVINLVTYEPAFSQAGKNWTGALKARLMTGGMEKSVRGETGFQSEKFAFTAGIGKKDFGDVIGGDTTGRQSPSGYQEWAFDMKGKWKLNKKWNLILAQQFLRQSHVPVYHKVRLENFALNEMNPQERLLTYARLRGHGSSKWLEGIEFTVLYQATTEGRNSQKNGSSTLRKERDQIGTAGVTLDILSVIQNGWTSNSGVEVYLDRVNSSREDLSLSTGISTHSRGLYPDDSKYKSYSIYSLHHFAVGRWMFDAGLRFNGFNIRLEDTTLGKVSISPAAFVGNAAALYRIGKGQSLFLSTSTGFRAPNIDDMGTLGIVDFRYELPSSSLRPEKSIQTEIGYKYSFRRFSGVVSAWYMHLKDIITRVKQEGQVIAGYSVYQKENTESAYIRGFETELAWELSRKMRVQGAVSYTFGQNLSKPEPLRRIPPLNGQFGFAFREKKWRSSVVWQFASKQSRLAQGDKDDNRIPKGGTPGWNTVNLYTDYMLKGIHLSAGLLNIFNEDYRTHGSGINGVGRSVWISLKFSIR